MIKRCILFFVPILLIANSYAQFNPGAKQISLSNSDVALSNDVFSVFNTPSGVYSGTRIDYNINMIY